MWQSQSENWLLSPLNAFGLGIFRAGATVELELGDIVKWVKGCGGDQGVNVVLMLGSLETVAQTQHKVR